MQKLIRAFEKWRNRGYHGRMLLTPVGARNLEYEAKAAEEAREYMAARSKALQSMMNSGAFGMNFPNGLAGLYANQYATAPLLFEMQQRQSMLYATQKSSTGVIPCLAYTNLTSQGWSLAPSVENRN